jgi:hypothetical protein
MPKNDGLVCQHLEHIDVSAFEDYQHIIRAYVRRKGGVYALYRRNKLYYIGLASDLERRLGAHLKDGHKQKWDSFSVYLTGNDQHLKELESLMLRVILPTPKGNKQSGKFATSENLRSGFKRDVNEYKNGEIRKLFGLAPKQSKLTNGTADSFLAQYVQRTGKSLQLRTVYKGKNYRAFVQKDGTVRFKNRKYSSPSAAGKAVNHRACNGWAFWRYQSAPGQWVRLSNLRSN